MRLNIPNIGQKKALILASSFGFIIGVALNLPVSHLVDNLLKGQMSKVSGVQLSYDSLSAGTTLGEGWKYGGLLGFKVKNLSLVLPRSRFEFRCASLTLSPKIHTLLWGALGFSAVCDTGGAQKNAPSKIQLLGEVKPFYSLKTLELQAELTNLYLENYSNVRLLTNLKGTLNGRVAVKGLNLLEMQNGNLGETSVDWDIQGEAVESPLVSTPVVSMPSFKMGSLLLKGKWTPSQLLLDTVKFGQKENVLEGDLKVDFKFDPVGQPIEGSILGKIRTEPNFEATQLSQTIPMDLYFGKVRESGFREFKKSFQGNITSLLINPPEPLN
jgi:hypothetical protein